MSKMQAKFVRLAVMFLVSIAIAVSVQANPVSAQIDTVVIIDAGSSGSKLMVYVVNRKDSIIVNENAIGTIVPGVDSFVVNNRYSQFADSVKAILDRGKNGEKISYKDSTFKRGDNKIHVLATAGMRILQQKDASRNITADYDSIKQQLKNNGCSVGYAMTISGRYEGLYAWIATHLLDTSKPINFGIIEIGGASLQQTYRGISLQQTNTTDTINHPKFGNIYSRSYLGWGINEVIKKDSSSMFENIPKLTGANVIWYALGGGFYKESRNNDVAAKAHEENIRKRYKKWLFGDKTHLDTLRLKDKPDYEEVSWTKGAAFDIITQNREPEKYKKGVRD